jgi:hypothetical protein
MSVGLVAHWRRGGAEEVVEPERRLALLVWVAHPELREGGLATVVRQQHADAHLQRAAQHVRRLKVAAPRRAALDRAGGERVLVRRAAEGERVVEGADVGEEDAGERVHSVEQRLEQRRRLGPGLERDRAARAVCWRRRLGAPAERAAKLADGLVEDADVERLDGHLATEDGLRAARRVPRAASARRRPRRRRRRAARRRRRPRRPQRRRQQLRRRRWLWPRRPLRRRHGRAHLAQTLKRSLAGGAAQLGSDDRVRAQSGDRLIERERRALS